MSTAVVRQEHEIFATGEHLIALLDTRAIVLVEQPELIAEIDMEIAEYARKYPDGFAAAIKACQAEQTKLKTIKQAASCKEGMWAAHEGRLRNIGLSVVKQTGPLSGSVFTISEKRGREHLVFTDRTLIPEAFLMIIPEQRVPDEELIEEALKHKQTVPGAKLERYESFVSIT